MSWEGCVKGIQQKAEELTGGKDTMIIAPVKIIAPAPLCPCIQSVKGFKPSTILSWKTESNIKAGKTMTTGRMASGLLSLAHLAPRRKETRTKPLPNGLLFLDIIQIAELGFCATGRAGEVLYYWDFSLHNQAGLLRFRVDGM
jgi:hypothetical protein